MCVWGGKSVSGSVCDFKASELCERIVRANLRERIVRAFCVTVFMTKLVVFVLLCGELRRKECARERVSRALLVRQLFSLFSNFSLASSLALRPSLQLTSLQVAPLLLCSDAECKLLSLARSCCLTLRRQPETVCGRRTQTAPPNSANWRHLPASSKDSP